MGKIRALPSAPPSALQTPKVDPLSLGVMPPKATGNKQAESPQGPSPPEADEHWRGFLAWKRSSGALNLPVQEEAVEELLLLMVNIHFFLSHVVL